MPAIDHFNKLVGEKAVSMQAIEDFCATAVSSASLGIVETARFAWGTLTLRRRQSGAAFTYHMVAQDENSKTVFETRVDRGVVGSAIAEDLSPIAAALLEDPKLLRRALKKFASKTLWPKLEAALLSKEAPAAVKSGRGPLRM